MRDIKLKRLNTFKVIQINKGMDELYLMLPNLYESLMDDEYSLVDEYAKEIIDHIKKISKEKYLRENDTEKQ